MRLALRIPSGRCPVAADGSAARELRLDRAIDALDRTTQFVERPVRGISGPARINPVVHAGTISVFLLGVVTVTGLYITLFFEFGFAASYGTGNTLAAERLAGERAPHPQRKFADRIASDFVASDQVAWAREYRSESSADEPSDLRRYAGVGLAVLLSIGGVVAATSAPFRSPDGARVRVVVDHTANAALIEYDTSPGRIDEVEVVADGQLLGRRRIPHDGATSVGFADWDVPAGTTSLELRAAVDGAAVTLLSGSFDLAEREQLVLSATDVPPPPGSSDGRDVFNSRSAGCTVCHSTVESRDGVGPSLYGVASVAGDRVEALSDELYLRQSILLPDQYIVDGWPAGQMLPIYRERLDEQQLEAPLTYLLTLTAEVDS
jgi:hypothetical protein